MSLRFADQARAPVRLREIELGEIFRLRLRLQLGKNCIERLPRAHRVRTQDQIGRIGIVAQEATHPRAVGLAALNERALLVVGGLTLRLAMTKEQQPLHATWYRARAPRSSAAATSLSRPSARRIASITRISSSMTRLSASAISKASQ